MNTYTRENIQSSMLKRVVFRIDFSGETDLQSFINRLKQQEFLKNAFGQFVIIPKRNISVSFKPKDIVEGQLPYAEAQNSILYRFYDCKIQDNPKVTLDLDTDSITLVVNCEDKYQGSSEYTNFISQTINELRSHDSYVSINRLGVRKIDVKVLEEGEEINDFFSRNFYVANSLSQRPERSKSVVTELIDIENIGINVTQQIDRVSDGKRRLIYDVDAFLEDNNLKQALDNNEIYKLLYHDMQDQMFELFKSVVSEKYLKNCKQQKEKQNG